MICKVGCSGWFYWHWRGLFYPESIPTSRWFSRYLAAFDTVELNAPFYNWPKLVTAKNWRRQAGVGFRYSVKVNQLITHEKRFVRTRLLVDRFYFIAPILGEMMGCFLFQLPPSYRYTRSRLKSIVSQLDRQQRNVVEFRHKSWWNRSVYRAFEEHNITFCSTSGPRLPDELVLTSDVLYVRFHGTSRWYRHDYSTRELEAWAERILDSDAKEAWVYFNNDRDGFALNNAQELREMLGVEFTGSGSPPGGGQFVIPRPIIQNRSDPGSAFGSEPAA